MQIDNLDPREVVDHIIASLAAGHGGWVATPNVDILRQAIALPELADLLGKASLVVADGMPLVWASRLQGTPLKARVAGSELVHPLVEAAGAAGLSLFLLGDAPGVAERAVATLSAKTPNLRVAGCYAPPFGLERQPDTLEQIVGILQQARPDIVICAFGFPKQERLISTLAPRFPAVWFLSAGAALSMLAGDRPQAPPWMRASGLEWVHRLRLEPARLFKRYLIDDLPFAVHLLAVSAVRRRRGAEKGPSTTPSPG